MANIIEPKIVVEWFIKNKLDTPRDTRKGNTKVQKLLFFAQLIYMCKNNGETMYLEPFRAFENGMVLETVRLKYKNNYNQLLDESKQLPDIPKEVEEALQITADIFGDCDADELSDLSHQFDSWSKYLRLSLEGDNYHNKDKAIIPYEDLEKELYKMQKVLDSYEQTNLITDEEDY